MQMHWSIVAAIGQSQLTLQLIKLAMHWHICRCVDLSATYALCTLPVLAQVALLSEAS